jgi:hypothetical protein
VLREVVEGRAGRHVRASRHLDRAGRGPERQRRQHGLHHQGQRAGGRDLELEVARRDRARLEAQVGRAFEHAAHARAAGERRRPHRGHVLGPQPGVGPARADARDLEPLRRGGGQRQRRAQDLAPAFAHGPVDGDELSHGDEPNDRARSCSRS